MIVNRNNYDVKPPQIEFHRETACAHFDLKDGVEL